MRAFVHAWELERGRGGRVNSDGASAVAHGGIHLIFAYPKGTLRQGAGIAAGEATGLVDRRDALRTSSPLVGRDCDVVLHACSGQRGGLERFVACGVACGI